MIFLVKAKQYDYQLTVLQKIDSAFTHPDFAAQIVTNNEIHLEMIIDKGVLYGNLKDVVWAAR